MLVEDRVKVKQYKYERDALNDFLESGPCDISFHVVNAVRSRLSVVERQIKMLS